MDAYATVMAWGAGLGLVVGLAMVRWGARGGPEVLVFLVPGLILFALFLYGIYIGDPESRATRKFAGVAPAFLAAAFVIAIARPFRRRRGRPRGTSRRPRADG